MKPEVDIQDNELYSQYVNEMFAYGMAFGIAKETVLDAIHDVFLHFIERKHTLQVHSNIKFYLLSSLKNRLFSIKRREINFEVNDDADNYEFSIEVSGLEDILEEEEERVSLTRKIEEMLNMLTNKQREVIYLRYMQDLSYDEIAELLHISQKAVRKLHYRALERIKEQYGPTFVTLIIFYLTIAGMRLQ